MVNSIGMKRTITALQKGKLSVLGQFRAGSNHTFLAQVEHQDFSARVVYKPDRGERPLWDFAPNTLARREVAAFLVSQALGWELVPPTAYRRSGPIGSGSVQLFLEHDPGYHYFTFTSEDRQRLQPAAAFDVIINNGDRKAGHILLDAEHHIWLIDHGVCFHTENKLRTVVWDFAGQPLPVELREDIRRLANRLNQAQNGLPRLLGKLLSPAEIQALALRAASLAEAGEFPAPDPERRHYPWPLVE